MMLMMCGGGVHRTSLFSHLVVVAAFVFLVIFPHHHVAYGQALTSISGDGSGVLRITADRSMFSNNIEANDYKLNTTNASFSATSRYVSMLWVMVHLVRLAMMIRWRSKRASLP
eukprot:TRINITY_DN33968_c0_g1_i1.p1 TRINITY_DN33968_c0_g1~~TRINITY_DN33968_c0_g1_i1.p1  ORF type:complete len:114 (-),score=10.98 TRINITY_DN33968_c0_g1_i1:2-343(-)